MLAGGAGPGAALRSAGPLAGRASRLQIETSDPDEAVLTLRTLLGSPIELAADPGDDFALRATASVAPELTFAEVALGFGGHSRVESFTDLLLATTTAGEQRWTVDGRHGDASTPLVVLPGQGADADFDRIRTYSATIPAEAAEVALASWSAGAPPSLAGARAADPLAALLRHLGATSHAFPTLFDEPLIRASAQQTLLDTLLVTSPPPDGAYRSEHATSRALRRALAYIDDHAAEPIAIADVATAARMSVRGLQGLFRRELGTTPAAHLRRVRLDRARADLLEAEPYNGVSVAQVAHRWGFTHLPRFAAAYQETYGELPSRTLRR